MELLGPVIEERMRQYNENGLDWEGKPVEYPRCL